jgi:hypothetical protein
MELVQGRQLRYLAEPLDTAILSLGVIGLVAPEEYYPFREEHDTFYVVPYVIVMHVGWRDVIVGLNMDRDTLETLRRTRRCKPIPPSIFNMERGKCYHDDIDLFLKKIDAHFVPVQIEYRPHYELCHYYDLLREIHRAMAAIAEYVPIEQMPVVSNYIGLLTERYPDDSEHWVMAAARSIAYDPTLPINVDRSRILGKLSEVSRHLVYVLADAGVYIESTMSTEELSNAVFSMRAHESTRSAAYKLLSEVRHLRLTLATIDETRQGLLATMPIIGTELVRDELRREAKVHPYDLSIAATRKIYNTMRDSAETYI